jgi:SAM-dependent methyltransferase
MGLIGGEMAYRFLRWYAPGSMYSGADGSAYSGRSKLRALLGEDLLEQIRNRDIIDFGCGAGDETIEMALAGARSVTGLDIQEHHFTAAHSRAVVEGVSDRVHFSVATEKKADIIVAIDSFEHFSDPGEILRLMSDLLRPSGKVVVSFGPTWYHPLGGHLFSVFPFAHLIFTESALIKWRSDFKSDGAKRFGEVAGGLNQMSVARFIQLVETSPLKIEHFEAVPIRRLSLIANRWTREFTTAIVRCTLIPR